MIAVVDLIAWAKKHAWGRSGTVPDGWIPSELLQTLVYEIKKVEPLNYEPQKKRPCDYCQEVDCYGCEHRQAEREGE